MHKLLIELPDCLQTPRLIVRPYRAGDGAAERCGFVREGHLRATHTDMLLDDGSMSGDYIYGLLRGEYERLRGSSSNT